MVGCLVMSVYPTMAMPFIIIAIAITIINGVFSTVKIAQYHKLQE